MPRDMEKRRASQRAASRRWYEANKDKQRAANLKRVRELLQWFRELKSTFSCADCGENHPACLDFHHNDPAQKIDTIFWAVHHSRWGRKKILAEIAKCTALCANCHRKRHWNERAASGQIVEEVA